MFHVIEYFVKSLKITISRSFEIQRLCSSAYGALQICLWWWWYCTNIGLY